MISPHKITYAGYSNEDFNLICDVAFDSDTGATSSFLSREAVASETYRGAVKHTPRYKYTEVLAPTITFVDKNFGDFTVERQRQILKWLTSKDIPSFLDVYHDNSDEVSYAILGNFVTCDSYKLANKRVVGFVCTFESVHPFALSHLKTVSKKISDPLDNVITIHIDTDDNQPVYPRITIKQEGTIVRVPENKTYTQYSTMVENTVYFNGTNFYWKASGLASGQSKPDYDGWTEVTITGRSYSQQDTIEKNTIYYYQKDQLYYWIEPYSFHNETSDPKIATTSVKLVNEHTGVDPALSTVVKNNVGSETIIIDGANQIISSSSVNRIFDTDFEQQRWLALYDGENRITIEGNCTVEISYREVRKIGEY